MTRTERAGAAAIAATCLILLAISYWPIARDSWGSGWWGIGVAVALTATAFSVLLLPRKTREREDQSVRERPTAHVNSTNLPGTAPTSQEAQKTKELQAV